MGGVTKHDADEALTLHADARTRHSRALRPLSSALLRACAPLPTRLARDRIVRAAMQAAEECLALTALPPALWHALFALLPVDQRLRCREVSRGWCASLKDCTLWTRLDLSDSSGVDAAQLEWPLCRTGSPKRTLDKITPQRACGGAGATYHTL